VNPRHLEIVAFDADDTLWHSEDGFRAVEERFVELVSPHCTPGVDVPAGLTAHERANLPVYGYGVKAFGLSMMEAAITITEGRVPNEVLARLLTEVRDLLLAPVRLLPHVSEVLETVGRAHRLALVTKGDLIHQTRKVRTSGLEHHFEHVEIVLEKDPETYRGVFARFGVSAEQVLMVGNSVRSDVLPVLALGGHAVHVPYPLLWELEQPPDDHGEEFAELTSIAELPAWLGLA
jgi:putative hydrolase of the HAD superfamily